VLARHHIRTAMPYVGYGKSAGTWLASLPGRRSCETGTAVRARGTSRLAARRGPEPLDERQHERHPRVLARDDLHADDGSAVVLGAGVGRAHEVADLHGRDPAGGQEAAQ